MVSTQFLSRAFLYSFCFTGKTAVSVALTSLFDFGHTQSDDIQAKKSAPAFIRNVVNLLEHHDIVIADKYE